jgi:localization factor PodJL
MRPASGFGSREAWLVMAYAQRLERDADVGVKEAFKVLHQGLSCLAGQITATDSHSAQIAALLTSNWEQLARRLSDIRLDVDDTHRVLDARLSIAEKAADYSGSALDHALEKIEAFARQRAMDQAENQRQSNRQEQVLERLSDAFLKLEKRLPEANITQRLEVVEQAVSGMAKPENSTAPLLSALQAVSHRLEALEKDHGDLLSELRARMFEAAPQPAMPQPVERIELPPLVEPPVVEADTGAAPDFEDLFAEAQPQPLNFLTRARMAAQVAPETPKPRYLFPAAVGLVIVLALAAGLVLHRRVETAVVAKPETAKADLAGPTYSVPAPPSAEDTQFVVAPDAATDPNTVAALQPDSQDSAPHAPAPLKPRTVRTAPVTPVPDSAKAASTAPPVDKVTQLANAGNPNALTILGLRALDGTGGMAVNLPDAVKYLSAAAEKGQAVAQYRLGTLYERGQGVTVDPVKAAHWYELSANQGNRKAMHNLAVSYASRKNMADAARWFAKASALGLSDSEFNLAVLYERGDGVPQSLVDAFKWYSIADAAGDVESKARVGVLQTQLNDADKVTAAKEIEAFHPLPFDHTANVPPEADQLPAS